jgi:tetratricopeptide (TPR) repeat protein
VLARQGKLKEATAEYQEALRIAPDTEAHYNLAMVLALDGNAQDSARHLEAALRLDPGFQPARAALQKLGASGAR